MPQLENPLLSALRVYSDFDAKGVICQNLLDLGWLDLVRGDVSFVVLIPVIPGAAIHVNTLDGYVLDSPGRNM